MIIRPVEPCDASAWESMRRDLWPEDPESHAPEIAAFFGGTSSEPRAVLLAIEGSNLVAFAELSIRDNLKELPGKRVGYVEGLYVAPPFRRQGIARKLLQASRLWARHNNCEAFASDRADRIVIDTHF